MGWLVVSQQLLQPHRFCHLSSLSMSGGSSFLSIIYVFINASITCIVVIQVEGCFVYSSPTEVLVTMYRDSEKCEQDINNWVNLWCCTCHNSHLDDNRITGLVPGNSHSCLVRLYVPCEDCVEGHYSNCWRMFSMQEYLVLAWWMVNLTQMLARFFMLSSSQLQSRPPRTRHQALNSQVVEY